MNASAYKIFEINEVDFIKNTIKDKNNVEVNSEVNTSLGNGLNYYTLTQDLSLPRITLNDPLITAIQNIINKELKLTRLHEEQLKMIIDIVHCRRCPD